MSSDNFIPQVWSARLNKNLNDDHVYASLVTRDWEGEIKGAGDSVRIHTVGRIAVSPYSKNSTSLTYENPTGDTVVLVVDQANSFSFRIDDVDKAQQTPKLMDAYMEEAAWGLSDKADADLASVLAAGVPTANKLGAASSVGTASGNDDAYEILVDLGVKLTGNNVLKAGRWAVIPPWYEGMLLKDPRFVSFGTSENLGRLKNGMVGRAAGFTVHVSNNVPVSSSAYTVVAGDKGAAAFAEQINEVETLRLESNYGTGMRGLHLYGRKVIDPSRLASVAATAAA